MSRRTLDAAVQLAGPVVLVLAAGLIAASASRANEIYVLNAILAVAIVVSIYVFVGNSGVLSFGQLSFVAVGAFIAGELTIPLESKQGVLTDLMPLLRDHTIGTVPSLLLAAALGGVFALVVGLPLMRLSGLAAGIATFAVLEITHNLLREWTTIGPGATTLALVPETTGPLEATVGALVVVCVAFAYQRSRLGRQVRATREDPAAAQAVGIDVHRQRLWAFVLSGTLAGFSGGLYVHMLGSITVDQVYLELTFLSLAMLVVGGLTSLLGAVVGAFAVSGVDSFLGEAEQGVDVGVHIDLPTGTRLVIVSGADGLGPHPPTLGHHRRPRTAAAATAEPTASRPDDDDPEGGSDVRICVIGCGAVGSLFAANLSLLGDVEVWAYDLDAAHVDAINTAGLRLSAR